MYISLYDLGLFILFCSAVTVSIYLVAVLRRAFGVLGHIRGILEAHEEDVRESLALLPQALANLNELSVSLREATDQTSSAIYSLQNNLAEDLRDGLETVLVYARVLGEIFRALFSRTA
ncbi:MAG TPA: hypothetical protein PKA10_06835 [Selenomonadales bacterium]|nr:hypothetical protein [Selenomonadales bacterium]